MSNRSGQTVGMKLKTPKQLHLRKTNEVVGFFRSTKIVRRYDGLHILRNGNREDCETIRNWCRCFSPMILFAEDIQVARN